MNENMTDATMLCICHPRTYIIYRAKRKGQAAWEFRYEELLKYKEQHGNCKWMLRFSPCVYTIPEQYGMF
jgi:hypothetical protein